MLEDLLVLLCNSFWPISLGLDIVLRSIEALALTAQDVRAGLCRHYVEADLSILGIWPIKLADAMAIERSRRTRPGRV